MMIDAFSEPIALAVTSVMPYYCYARQGRARTAGVPCPAKLVADRSRPTGREPGLDARFARAADAWLLQCSGRPHLYCGTVLIEYFKQKKLGELTLVSPDAGGSNARARSRKKLDSPRLFGINAAVDIDVSEVIAPDRRGPLPHQAIIDDIIDTGWQLW